MTKAHGSVRIGPISIFTLIIVLCLAVLAVLSVTTARAGYAITQRQASMTEATYANERAAQEFVAGIDAALQPVRADVDSHTEGSNASRLDQARQLVLEALPGLLAESAKLDGNTVHASFATDSGRSLSIELLITPSATYEIQSWRATTLWDENQGEELWKGSAAGQGNATRSN